MKNTVLGITQKKDAARYLSLWASSFLKIEEKYYIKQSEINNTDYVFLKLIGQSIYNLNSFNSLIISALEDYADKVESEKEKETLKGLSSYSRFLNSLIASKIKFFFFRETPIKSTNIPFIKVNIQILKSGMSLIEELHSSSMQIEKACVSASKHFFYQNLLYSFIYNSEKEKGLFLKFNYNKNIFLELAEIIRDKINSIHSEGDLRFIGSNVIAILANYYLSPDESCLNANSTVKKPDCYNKLFFKLRKDDSTFIEPITCHLGDILWKLDGLIHDDDEYVAQDDKSHQETLLVAKVNKFIGSFLSSGKEMYNEKQVDYLRLFQLENIFFQEIYRIVFHHENVDDVREKFSNVRKLTDKAVTDNITVSFKSNNGEKRPDLSRIFNKVRDSGEKGFKIETLIEVLPANELLFLFTGYAKLITDDITRDDHTEYVGFYKSGVFLGHLVNMIKSDASKYKPIWLFKSKPYVSTNPAHKDKKHNDFNKILVFDECFKTGFTYSLYESYLKRNLSNTNISISPYSLFDFKYYDKIEFHKHIDFRSLIKLSDTKLPINNNELQIIGDSIKNEDTLSIPFIPDIDIESLIENTQYIYRNYGLGENRGMKRVDLTFLLSDTLTVFSICEKFVKKILECHDGEMPIHLSSASSDGEVLLLVTSFLLKIPREGKKSVVIKFGNGDIGNKDILKIAIDLSLFSGFSLAYKTCSSNSVSWEKGATDQILNQYDLICAIISQKQHQEKQNLFCLHYTN